MPSSPQTWTPFPEHCRLFGAQLPAHWLFAQIEGQASGGPQRPVGRQVSTELPLHRVELGAQSPWQVSPTQAWFPQHYWDYALRFDETRSWLVLWRDVTLVALLGVLVAPPGYLLRLTRPLRPRLGSDPQHGRSEQSPA